MKTWLRLAIPLALGIGTYIIPTPESLTSDAWAYFAIFIGTVAALILEPLPASFCGLISVILIVTLKLVALQPEVEVVTPKLALQWGLSGFQNATVWLIFTAYIFSLGYQKTGLGKRISLYLIKWLGGNSLGLSYAIAFADLLLAPFVPSNTARSGGIIYPIVSNIPSMYDSSCDNNPRKIGSFLYWTGISTTCVTSSMFMTGLAPNLLAISIVERTANITISWSDWFIGFAPVGLLLFLSTPWINYLLYPPTQKQSKEMPQWASEQIKSLGALSRSEIYMLLLALFALVLWIAGGSWLTATGTSLVVLCLMVLTGIISWQDVIGHKQAWNVLIWFATLVTLAGGLTQTGILTWLTGGLAGLVVGQYPTIALIVCFFLLHYFFASITAHVTALLPVFMTLAMVTPGVSIQQTGMMFCFVLGIMGILTPYATGPSPIWYGSGFLPAKNFWLLGAAMGGIYLSVLLLVGLPWLNFIHG
ncbi:MAG: DASS family sodium-coupled anion symporter [Candidatus Endonucleobacter sp. (ex Gigantidas childressi)]|nr:DASS family sodium-coupled anion symporter [Candidatus Endonucleobacter sp. (ex Gigantidas childressi)]